MILRELVDGRLDLTWFLARVVKGREFAGPLSNLALALILAIFDFVQRWSPVWSLTYMLTLGSSLIT